MTIADVIGWKFDYQPGMTCREVNGVLNIVEFPGGIPSQAEQDQWTAEYQAWIASGGMADKECTDELATQKIHRLLFKMNFDQENRLRTLEGRATITEAQYRNGLLAVWRTL